MDELQERISDEMTERRRLAAMLKMTENLPTEDIELLNKKFPRLAECALHELLNPELGSLWDLSELRRMLGVKTEPESHCAAHWTPLPCIFCQHEREAAS